MSMELRLNDETSRQVKELAEDMGLTTEEVVQKIVEWYFEDNQK